MPGKHRQPEPQPEKLSEAEKEVQGKVYKSRHSDRPAGSDLPARGEGVTIEDA